MNIAVIAADLELNRLGGAEHHVVEVIKRLHNRHQFTLFVGKSDEIKNEFSSNVHVIKINYPRIPNLIGICYILSGYISLLRHFNNTNYDVIWAKQSYPQAPLAALLAKKYNIPLYITAQNPNLLREELVVQGSFFKPFYFFFASLLEPIIKWSYRNATLVAAVSSYSARLAKQFGAKNVTIIPNGIDLKRFSSLDKKMKNKKYFTIISTSSLIPRNGMDILIEAVALLPKTKSWQVLIAGEGAEKQRLQTLISKRHLNKRVRLVGRIDNDAIPSFLASADLFVRPSRHEGFGVSFIEAMAAGVSVIATPVGGIVDFISHNKTGILVKSNSPEATAKEIERLLTNDKLRSSISQNGSNFVLKNYNWNKIANEVNKVFSKIT